MSKQHTVKQDIEYLGLQECEFDDECDFCDEPEGGTFAAISSGDGYTETDYYICFKCVPEHAKDIRDSNEELAKQFEAGFAEEPHMLEREVKP